MNFFPHQLSPPSSVFELAVSPVGFFQSNHAQFMAKKTRIAITRSPPKLRLFTKQPAAVRRAREDCDQIIMCDTMAIYA
jgi:hypothetical protein